MWCIKNLTAYMGSEVFKFTALVSVKVYLSQLFRVVVAVENSGTISRIDSLQELAGMSVML